MKKTDFLIEDFKNIQELIRFTDQKAAAILVVFGILLNVFIEINKKFSFSSIALLKEDGKAVVGIMTFCLGITFSFLMLSILYLCIFRILKPQFAKHYNGVNSSLFYFEHIANRKKEDFKSEINKLDKDLMNENLSDQIYETSIILIKKSKICSLTMKILFITVLNLVFYILLSHK